MKNTDRMFIEKLKAFSKQLENADEENIEEIKEEMRVVLDTVVSDYTEKETEDRYSFAEEKMWDLFAENDNIRLCKVCEIDRETYIKLAKENSVMPRAYELEGFEDLVWEDMTDPNSFYVFIYRKKDDAFIGYCGIKNLQKAKWELAIEILMEFQHQGYGRSALNLYMKKAFERSGISTFYALVDGENESSQKMCEALGGVPNGIAEHLLHDQEFMDEYERENVNEVTEAMKDAALKFGIAPEKLLTHVLEYKFVVTD